MDDFASPRSFRLGQFLTDGNCSVPNLQRNYSWSTPEAGQLWSDFLNHLDSRAAHYYLGNIIYFPEGQERMVVDGQQRLATATILFCAVRDAVREAIQDGRLSETQDITVGGAEMHLADHLTQLTELVRRRGKKDEFYLQLKQSDAERLLWIQKSPGTRPVRRRNGRGFPKIYRVYDHLLGNARDLANPDGIDRLCALTVALRDAVVTCTKVPDLLTAFTIFSTVNARGKDLTLADLVRVQLLEKWRKLDRRHPTELTRQLDKMELVDYDELQSFMRRYWIIRTGRKTSRAETARQVLMFIREAKKTSVLLGFVEEMGTLMEAYAHYRNVVDGGATTEFERRLAVFALSGFAQHIPAMVAILARDEQEGKDAHALLRTIESSYVYLNLLMDKAPAEVEALFAQLARTVHEKGPAAGQAELVDSFGRMLDSIQKEGDWFCEAFGRMVLGADSAQFLLRTLEKARHPAGGILFDFHKPKELHLEHVLPQNPAKTEWPKKWQNEETRGEFLWLPGNLTLLERRLNSEASNGSFDHKKPIYKNSGILMTQDLAGFAGWDEPAIGSRSDSLAQAALAIWGWQAVSGDDARKPRLGRRATKTATLSKQKLG